MANNNTYFGQTSTSDGNTKQCFYRPKRDLYTPREKICKGNNIKSIIPEWPYANQSTEQESLLGNAFPWQRKWYLKFVPPKSSEELQIGQYLKYDGPLLEHFIADSQDKQMTQETLNSTSISALKSMASKILSGMTQDTLSANSYRLACESKSGSQGREREGSTVSSHLRMPENQGGEKRSILASYTLDKNKSHKKSKP
uniref:Uncharacterized protein n=2 Tax=Babesia bovis TaxID=5865 RepID=A7AV82_BABBO|eukprot:XP_001609276.1 hypothetical protein [Babesia bovis T2Bo]